MDERTLWALFLATGSPLVWLMVRRLEREREEHTQTANEVLAYAHGHPSSGTAGGGL